MNSIRLLLTARSHSLRAHRVSAGESDRLDRRSYIDSLQSMAEVCNDVGDMFNADGDLHTTRYSAASSRLNTYYSLL